VEGKHSLLVVDDEPGIVESVYYLLRSDYKVYKATSADEALEVMKNEEIHIIMTDQRMPFMTGVDLLTQLKGDYPDAIRILFTGYADLDAVIAAINQGNVFRYLAKPWNPDELKEAVGAAAVEYERIIKNKEMVEALRKSALAFGSRANISPALISALSDVLVKMCQACQAGGNRREVVQQCARSIAAESERLTTLVASTLNLLMQDALPMAEAPEVFTLREVAEPLQSDLAPILKARNIRLHTKGDISAPVCHNRDLVRGVLCALLSNAVRFSPDNSTIELQAGREDDTVTLQVSDEGEGIPAEDLPHVFEPFFTSQHETRPMSASWRFGSRGVGLGLAIAKKFVEAHGGSIIARNRPGGGTVMTIKLQAPPENEEPRATPRKQEQARSSCL